MVVFTTLAENDYFLGLSALINSIVKNGVYGDKLVVGYRGDLPNWLPKLFSTKNGKSFVLNNTFEIEFVTLVGSLHMVHEKPKWFKHLTEVLEPNADEYFFFDSDIVILNRMNFFGEWVKQGVAICEDVNYDMSFTHPIRKQWITLGIENGKTIENNLSRYYNSGFLGWSRSTVRFIEDWDECFSLLALISGDMTKFRVNDRTNVVLSANQDSLNLAAMVTKCPISVIGPEAMGFHYGLPLMAHPLGPKPWNINFLLDFLKGKPPRYADLLFWEHANSSVLKPYNNFFVRKKVFIITLFRFLSRFYRKK